MTWTKEMKINIFELRISHTKEITGAIADSLNVMYLKLLRTLRLAGVDLNEVKIVCWVKRRTKDT